MPPKASLATDLVSTTPSFSGFVVTLLCLYVATAFLLAVPVMAIMAAERDPGARRRRRGLSIHMADDRALARRRVLVHQRSAAATPAAPGTAGVAATTA
jgi:hypothetical protein